MLILHDPQTLQHQTVELLGAKVIPALESPERIQAILSAVSSSANHKVRTILYKQPAPAAEPDSLLRLLSSTHDAGYIEHLRTVHAQWVADGHVAEDEAVLPECFPHVRLFDATRGGAASVARARNPPRDVFARTGYYAFDMSTGIAKDTWISALASANLAVQGARQMVTAAEDVDGEPGDASVFALCRPPGHHCTTNMAGGYCYINNVVVAVHALRERLADSTVRVAVLDLDFHHGNGTQEVFYDDPSVLYVSIHGRDEYPYYCGFEDETGSGPGEGYNLNLPLPPRSSAQDYAKKLAQAITRIERFAPPYMIVSLGFDTYVTDPLGSFHIDTEDYAAIAHQIKTADGLRKVPSLILLEGGYVIEKLGDNVLSFLSGWESKGS